MATLADDGLRVIDADTHFTEPYDLWTSRAPAAYKDRVLHIEQRDEGPSWVVDGVELGFAKGGGVVDRDKSKIPFLDSMDKGHDWVHRGAWDPEARLAGDGRVRHPRPGALPERGRPRRSATSTTTSRTRSCACCASRSTTTRWRSCRRARTSASSPCRSCPRGTSTSASGRRCGARRTVLRGINMTSDPQDLGSPDLANRALGPAVGGVRRPAPAGALPHRFEQHRDGLLRQLLLGVAGRVREAGDRRLDVVHQQRARRDQHRVRRASSTASPRCRWCRSRAASAGSRSSWRRWTTSCWRTRPTRRRHWRSSRRSTSGSNWYATFWFETNQGDVQGLLDKVGDDRVLFETDFPHPTCLYPAPLETVAAKMNTLRPESRRAVMGENAARLYRV